MDEPSEEQEELQRRLADIGRRFLARTLGELDQLDQALADVRRGDHAKLGQIQRIAHKIHGGGGMFGFDGVSARAKTIETLAADASSADARVEELERSIERLRVEIRSIN